MKIMHSLIAGAVLCSLAGCASTPAAVLAQPTPAIVTKVATDATAAVAVYQAALGAAEQAEAADPKLAMQISTLAADAAPYVAAVNAGAQQAQTAPTLANIAGDLLLDAAPYVLVSPK